MLRTLLVAAAIFAASTSITSAQIANSSVFYAGTGSNNDGSVTETDGVPFAIGVLGMSDDSPFVFGVDLAGEGEMLDSTYGDESLRQALSFNALIGTNIMNSGSNRADVSVLLGLRESVADCPDSFLGYQCYADQEPEVEYEFNYGALFSMKFDQVTLGIRATEVSTQAIIGFSF